MDQDEELGAERKEVAEKIIETAGELENLLKGGKLSKPLSPREQAFWEAAHRLHEETEAKAALLEELIELVLPEAKLSALPLRKVDGGAGSAERVAELEKLFGNVPAKAREAVWLNESSVLLGGGYSPPLAHAEKAANGDSGFLEGERLHMLLDGRLVVVRLAGVWFVENNVMDSAHVIVEAREVTPVEAVDEFPFQFILTALRMCLMQDYSFLKDKHVPDLDERTERFDNLVIEYGQAVSEHVARLRRVGDSPA
ncbi:hypothetical protein [Hyalangium sp.]|uniref:hypothetical protein n=1 Tax=Hyalangium sp. TaxID=2028555 RepID=UPI002D2B2F97|nr:hypothetical protein [Hyalangium sp.]HYH95040.1 hypothetical protein [Hyalangium sp.]